MKCSLFDHWNAPSLVHRKQTTQYLFNIVFNNDMLYAIRDFRKMTLTAIASQTGLFW